MSDDFFAPPAFKPEQALLNLRRSLRDLRPLSERGNSFLLQGQPVIELSADTHALQAKLAKRPSRSPEWDSRSCKSSAEVRTLLDDIKKRLAHWTDDTP